MCDLFFVILYQYYIIVDISPCYNTDSLVSSSGPVTGSVMHASLNLHIIHRELRMLK